MTLGVNGETSKGQDDDDSIDQPKKEITHNQNHIRLQRTDDQQIDNDVNGRRESEPAEPSEYKSHVVDVHIDSEESECHLSIENNPQTRIIHHNLNNGTDDLPNENKALQNSSEVIHMPEVDEDSHHCEKENYNNNLAINHLSSSNNHPSELGNDIEEISNNDPTEKQQKEGTQSATIEENNTSNVENRGTISELKIGLILLILIMLVGGTIYLALPPKRNKDAFL